MTERSDESNWSVDLDTRVRTAAFAFLTEQVALHGATLPWRLLSAGFHLDGQRVPLVGQQGIFKPAILPQVPLSIRTAPLVEGRTQAYADELRPDGLLVYRYRGTDPQHRDNVALRIAGQKRIPLAYFFGMIPGEYLAAWPAYVVHDDPSSLAFTVEVDAKEESWAVSPDGASMAAEGRRRYVTQLTLRRVHQESFRWRVLRAYRERCAVCRLRHTELLDAAHILPDGHPNGEPIIPNGLALCKLHHAAFDSHFLGIKPDLVIDVRADILKEPDGPVLRHGLQGFHGQTIHIPRIAELKPSRDFLAERYDLFKKAG